MLPIAILTLNDIRQYCYNILNLPRFLGVPTQFTRAIVAPVLHTIYGKKRSVILFWNASGLSAIIFAVM